MLHSSLKSLAFASALLASVTAVSAGELVIVGTGDGMDILNALGSSFTADNPGSIVVVPPSVGSGGGIRAVGTDQAVLARVARQLTTSETEAGLVYSPIAQIPSVFYTHPGVGVSNLAAAEIAGIFAGKITNWREVGGADLRIRVVRREDADSTLQVLRESMPGWRELAITEKSKLATTTQEALESVRATPGAIGFGPFSQSLPAVVKVLKVDGKAPLDKNYPSGATLAFVHKEKTVTPEARAFMSFAGTQKARALISAAGAVPKK
jgi:phosphate transport system substrate-binding protein